MELEKYPYVLALTQPICTSTVFGLLSLVSYFYRQHRLSLSTRTSNSRSLSAPDDASVSPGPSAVSIFGDKSSWDRTSILAFVLIGFLLSLANFLQFTGSRGSLVSGPLVVLLQQCVLPFTVMFGALFLKTRLTINRFLGIAIVISGVALVAVTDLCTQESLSSRGFAVVLIILACVPNALALVAMERLLRAAQVEVWWLWCWINVFEVFFAVPIAFAQMAIESETDYAAQLHAGYAQFFGGSSVAWFGMFVCLVVLAKGLSYVVIVLDGATLAWLAVAAAIPLADILFSTSAATRSQGASWLWAVDCAGLVVVVGLAVYHSAHRGVRRWCGVPAGKRLLGDSQDAINGE